MGVERGADAGIAVKKAEIRLSGAERETPMCLSAGPADVGECAQINRLAASHLARRGRQRSTERRVSSHTDDGVGEPLYRYAPANHSIGVPRTERTTSVDRELSSKDEAVPIQCGICGQLHRSPFEANRPEARGRRGFNESGDRVARLRAACCIRGESSFGQDRERVANATAAAAHAQETEENVGETSFHSQRRNGMPSMFGPPPRTHAVPVGHTASAVQSRLHTFFAVQ